ncbi:antirepressor [Xenorhabdus mauleonii]|uniref:Antirepressor n=1 Tax=Xenorhabdus mauleonii TaxID=351675 RepID=A0A1I3U824_9GAMM|nr:DNA-binding protein [Xenorhabdus mauleonii]PHM45901.1 antirepressor [Xenorhabdus mauleonii]SFJ77921.1 Phage antirepressor protein YoqD, KilAC domain [Xenorhabdus mauleonii]
MTNLLAHNLTMSSREIADLVESRHDSVKRTIERLAERGIIQHPPLVEVRNHQNQAIDEYRIGKRDSYVIVAQLSPEFTARLVDRWQALEQHQVTHIPQTLPDALRLAADLAEHNQALESQLAAAAPKVAFVDRYVNANGSMTFRQVCKLIEVKEPEFRGFLLDKRIMYRLNGTMLPYQHHIDAKRFEVKTGTNITNAHAFTQTRFTAKGIRWVAGLWAEYKVGCLA